MRLSRRAMLGRAAAATACTVALASLATCADLAQRLPLTQPSSVTPRTYPLSIGLAGEPSIDELPLLHLASVGALRGDGLELQVIRSAGEFESLPALLAGKVQLALLDIPTAFDALSKRVELVGVFQLYWTDPTVVLALSLPGLTSAAALVGRPVGLRAPRGAPLLALATALGAAGLPVTAVRLVRAEANPAPALERGQLQAVVASSHLVTALEAAGLRVVVLPRNGWETIPGPVLVTTRLHLNEQRPMLLRLAGALRQGILELIERPDQLQSTAATLSAGLATRPRLLQAQVAAVLTSLRAYRADVGPGWFDLERLAAADRFLRELDPRYSGINPPAAFVNEFLTAAPVG